MKHQNIGIIGAGIMGLCTAHVLQKRGAAVTLYDPALKFDNLAPDNASETNPLSHPTPKTSHSPRTPKTPFSPDLYYVKYKSGEKGTKRSYASVNASAMAGGMLAPFAEIEHMPARWVEAGLAGIEFWRNFAKLHDIGFRQNGSLLIAHTEDRYMLERFQTHLAGYKATNAPSPNPTEEKTSPPHFALCKIKEVESQLSARFADGIELPQEAHLDPQQTLRQLFCIMQNKGVKLEAVRANREGMEFDAACIDEDELIALSQKHDTIIDCRGMGAQNNTPKLRGVKGEILQIQNEEFSLSRPVRLMHPRYPLYIVPRDDHIFTIGATVIESAEDTNVTLRSAMELLSAAYSLHPSFGDARVLSMQAGIRPAYPDNLPRLGFNGNIVNANGLFRHGYLLAPVMAEALANRLEGRDHAYMSLFENTGDTRTHSVPRAKRTAA